MAAERDFELLDDYLANRMPAEERAAFEQKIQADPALQQSMAMQQALITSIRQARAAELKGMLNNVPISSIPGNTNALLTKTLVGVGVAAVIGTAIYLLSNTQQEVNTVTPTQADSAEAILAPAPTTITNTPEQTIVAEASTVKKEVSKSTSTKKKAKKTVTPAPIADKIKVFDPSEDLQNGSTEPSENDILAIDDISTSFKASIAVTVDSTSRRHTFHYQLENDALLLYGPFEKNLFEILEFFSDNKRTAFLYYKKTYYYLKETDKTTALAPVQDPALLNKLRQYRTKN